MVNRAVHSLIGLNALSFILNTVGVFTPGWFVVSYFGISEYQGIVPYYTDELFFFAIASWLMFITVALSIITILLNAMISPQLHRNGFDYRLHKLFNAMAIVNIVSILFTVIALVQFGTALQALGPFASLGYSAWLCVAAAVVNLGIVIMSFHIAYRYCLC